MKPICRYHLKGTCRFGAKCRNSHQNTLPPPPALEECVMCRTKASLNSRKLCEKCKSRTCIFCFRDRVHHTNTCIPCQHKLCEHCKSKQRLPEGHYCENCSLFCKGCNPSTPSYFYGPLCKNCQDWCPRCVIEKKEKVLKHPGEKYCQGCLQDLCCGYSGSSRFGKTCCLTCRIPKKCSIPCCEKTVKGKRSAPCSDCQNTRNRLLMNYLKPNEISTKYSVRVRYEQTVQDHDGYCSDHYNDVDYDRTFDAWIPLPSMLDSVADSVLTHPSPSPNDEESEEEDSDNYDGPITEIQKNFKWSIVYGSNPRRGPVLPQAYSFFYELVEGCHRGSGYCGLETKSIPLFVEILRL